MDWEWPDELDALVAAPAHHTLLLENERVPAPLPPHSIENVGETDLRVIMVELKD
jgi:hypothetical protein